MRAFPPKENGEICVGDDAGVHSRRLRKVVMKLYKTPAGNKRDARKAGNRDVKNEKGRDLSEEKDDDQDLTYLIHCKNILSGILLRSAQL